MLVTINANMLMGYVKKFASTSSSFLRVQLGFVEGVIAFVCFVMFFTQGMSIYKLFELAC